MTDGAVHEIASLQNEIASLRELLRIAEKSAEEGRQIERRDCAQRELTYQKIIDQLLDKLADCDRIYDD